MASQEKYTQNSLTRGAAFHERLATHWNCGYSQGGFQRRLIFIKKHIVELVQEGHRWLDAGCGSGVLTRELAVCGAVGDAVDASPAMIEAALSEYGSLKGRFRFRCIATVELLDAPDEAYDGVFCSSVIEYIEHPESALREFARVIRPGGVLFISVANSWSAIRLVQRLLRWLLGWFGRDRYSYLSVSKVSYTRQQILMLLRSAGFTIERIDTFDPVLSLWWLPDLLPSSLFFVTARRLSRDDA